MSEDRAAPVRPECYFIEDLSVGQSAEYARTVTEADLVLFAGVSGDSNPVHMNDVYAKGTMFGGRIAHGMLVASLISATIAGKLPGPGSVYMGQSLKFRAPVRIGETVKATVTVTNIETARRRVTLKTICTVGDAVVIEGEALIMVPSRG